MTTTHKTIPITRRRAIGTGILGALGSLTARTTLATTLASPARREGNRIDANLYAFPGRGAATTVIAVTWAARLSAGDQQLSEIRIHVGSRSWVFEISPDDRNTISPRSAEGRMFVGRVAGAGREAGSFAAVLEVSDQQIAGDWKSGIWAQCLTFGGTRQRIGSPFLTEILSHNGALAERYDAISPIDDRAFLTQAVAEAIAERARHSSQITNPDAHGRRLASILLPDVLYYDPSRPWGFTFAGRNGRHPGDGAQAVVATTVLGFPAPVRSTNAVGLKEEFPYFSPLSIA